jgi:hypothetical protein
MDIEKHSSLLWTTISDRERKKRFMAPTPELAQNHPVRSQVEDSERKNTRLEFTQLLTRILPSSFKEINIYIYLKRTSHKLAYFDTAVSYYYKL